MPDGSVWRAKFFPPRVPAIVLALLLATAALPSRAEPAASVNAASQDIIGVAGAGDATLRVRVFRPAGNGPFPLAIINHGSPAAASKRPEMAVPVFAPASNWLIARGYLVALPLRRGYGETGGAWAEGYGACRNPDYYRAGLTTADDIEATLAHFRARADVARERALVVGYSAGGWGALALASRNPAGVQAVLNFAGGRGGGQPEVGNCTPQRLIDAAGRYGARARIASLWLYAANDTFFVPDLSRKMYDAYVGAGGPAEYAALPKFGSEGHYVFSAAAGRALWQPPVDGFLGKLKP